MSFFCQELCGQELSTQGTEFYASFMKNGYRGCNGSPTNNKLTLIASAPRTCTVTIQNPHTGWSSVNTLPAGSMGTFSIPEDEGYNNNHGVVTQYGLKITSSDTISLFIANEATNSFDASLVLPTHALGEKYITQNYTPSNNTIAACSVSNHSCFLVIATEDSTIVDITPAKATLCGHSANTPFSVTLNEGECYQVFSATAETGGDLSGSRVESRACKKVAVFNGNVLTGIPTGQSNGYDHIFEQAIPVNFLGRRFVPTASMGRQGGFIKITASADNTEVKINGIVSTTLNAYESHEFYLTAANQACFIETSMPSVVHLYNPTSVFDNSSRGDPSMIWIAPIEQQINEIIFCTFSAQNVTSHYVNVVFPTSGASSLRLDNTPVSAGNIQVLASNSTYSYARLSITAGTHKLRNDEGFCAFIYGLGNDQGYGYAVGARTVPSENDILINQRPSEQIPDGYPFCVNTPINFSIYSQYTFDTITWIVDDQPPIATEELTHAFSDTGTYQLTAIVTFFNLDCVPPFVDTLICQVHISDFEKNIIDTVCAGTIYNRYGFNFTARHDTIAIRTAVTGYDCDSLISLQLKVYPSYSFSFTQHVEFEDLPFQFGGNNYTEAGNYTFNPHTIQGCDSIYSFQLIVHRDYLFTETITICEGERHVFRGRELTAAGIYYDSLQTILGDDSVYQLILHVGPVYETQLEVKICDGEIFYFQGDALTTTGEYRTNLLTQAGCDSTVILHLTVTPSYYLTEHVNLCSSNYYYRGDTLRESGTYIDSLLTAGGCDSVLILILNFVDPSETILEDVVCLNEYYRKHNLIVPPHTDAGTYYYEFMLSDQYGCDSLVRLTLTVPDVRVMIISSSEDFCDTYFAVLQAITPNGAVTWNTGENSFTIEATKPGMYKAVVTDDICQATATHYIEYCPFNIFLPNAISPNRVDGINDAFFLANPNEINEISILIYDRWGTLVFYSKDPYFRWDGTVNGKLTVNQVFNYMLIVTPTLGKKQKIVGTVTVM
jgi:gliding motility-associated-like protein